MLSHVLKLLVVNFKTKIILLPLAAEMKMEQGHRFSICVLHWLTDKESMNIHYIDGNGQNVNTKTFPSSYAPFHGIIICHRCKEGKKTNNTENDHIFIDIMKILIAILF